MKIRLMFCLTVRLCVVVRLGVLFGVSEHGLFVAGGLSES